MNRLTLLLNPFFLELITYINCTIVKYPHIIKEMIHLFKENVERRYITFAPTDVLRKTETNSHNATVRLSLKGAMQSGCFFFFFFLCLYQT